MTTITAQASDDDFDKVAQNIDWIEQLESIRARRDKESATRETIEYVARLRTAIAALASDTPPAQIAAQYGSAVAAIVSSLTDSEEVDPWTEYLLPALLS